MEDVSDAFGEEAKVGGLAPNEEVEGDVEKFAAAVVIGGVVLVLLLLGLGGGGDGKGGEASSETKSFFLFYFSDFCVFFPVLI